MSIHRGSDAPRRLRVALPYASAEVTWAAVAVFAVSLAIYARTLLPGVGFWDTGEAQTVPHTLSIFHPTGFPTYALVGWAWSQLPLGEVAWRMNLLSAVCLAAASALVVLVTAQLVGERHRVTVAGASAVAGLAFAFAPEPWRDAVRADVHALHIAIAAGLIWLLVCWRSAEWGGAAHPGRWLAAAAFLFGIGMGNHPLTGLLAFGIGAWLVLVDRSIWRRWRLLLACALLLVAGLAVYLYIPIRANVSPEPPLFYAHPRDWDGFRYLVFAEQFQHLFDPLGDPLRDLGAKWAGATYVLTPQLAGPGWLVAAIGAAILAVRHPSALVFLGLLMAANIVYSMNFNDGDISRYYLLSIFIATIGVGVAISAFAAAAGRAVAEATRRAGPLARRRAAVAAAAGAIGLGLMLPVVSFAGQVGPRVDGSANRDADRWVAAVDAALPPDAVIISWWSYSTPLWYHRWVDGERPDVKIIDERNIIDDGYGTIDTAIETFLGRRPVYVVPPVWELDHILETWKTRTVQTYAGYTDLLEIERHQ